MTTSQTPSRVDEPGHRPQDTSSVSRGGGSAPGLATTGAQILALSVRQPWAWALLHGGKDVENRTWRTNYRGSLVIHAGKTGDGWGAHEAVHDLSGKWPDDVRGAFLGVVNLIDCHATDECEHICPDPDEDNPDVDEWRVPCTAHPGWCNNVCSEWAQHGQFHWVVERPATFPGIVGNGRLGLFVPPSSVVIAASTVPDHLPDNDESRGHGSVR